VDEALEDDFALTHPLVAAGRASHDHFPTPTWVIERLWSEGERWGWWEGRTSLLDPACGEGQILTTLRPHGLHTLGLELDPLRAELARQAGHEITTCDAFSVEWPAADLLVMNSPYGDLALPFLRKALAWRQQEPNRRVCALYHLSFFDPMGGRYPLFAKGPPDVVHLHRRPKFGMLGTGPIGSSWYCWPGWPGTGKPGATLNLWPR
jgi:hypothetical protein